MLAFPVLLRLTMTQELTGASLALTKPSTMPIPKRAFLAKKEPTTILQLALAFLALIAWFLVSHKKNAIHALYHPSILN